VRVLLIEPYYGGSHRAWADGYKAHSRHEVTLLTLPAQFWKWRMQGAAVTLARMFQQRNLQPDAILASDMINLATFRALTRQQTGQIPTALYFHENQLSYPQNRRQGHGWRYGFVNYISALAADALYFNSAFHQEEFFTILPKMLRHFADYRELDSVAWLRQRAQVLPVGLDLQRFDAYRVDVQRVDVQNEAPVILWNHRWEEDKNPRAFFKALYQLVDEGIDFRLVVLGENFVHVPPEFAEARERLADRILQFGYAKDFASYAQWLWQADYVVSTALHDFFGVAMAEAIYCGCVPILPKRLNYPALIPAQLHEACLYPKKGLHHLLRAHLTGEVSAAWELLSQHITRYAWEVVAPHYDSALENLLQQPPSSSLLW